MSKQFRFLFGRVFLVHQGRGFKSPIHPSRGQLLIAEVPSYERRDLATLEGMDGVSEVIKLVIKLCNRRGGEGEGGCLEKFNFPAGLVSGTSLGSSWGDFFFFFSFLIPALQGWKENLAKWYLCHPSHFRFGSRSGYLSCRIKSASFRVPCKGFVSELHNPGPHSPLLP